MKSRPLIQLSHLFGAIIVIGLVALIAWIIASADADSKSEEPSVSSSAANGSERSSENLLGPATSAERFGSLQRTVEKFVRVYYYRDADTTEATLREQLSPLVTETFLDNHMPSLSTESDEWVVGNDGVIEASAQIIPSDAGVSNKHAIVTVDVTATGEANGVEEQPFTFTVVLDLVWQQKNWLVNDL